MPQSDGGYLSLNEGTNIYNTTTEPARNNSVLESVKKAIGQAIGAQDTKSLLNNNGTKGVQISPMNYKR